MKLEGMGVMRLAWFDLLPDAPEHGSYYLLWDDGFCDVGGDPLNDSCS